MKTIDELKVEMLNMNPGEVVVLSYQDAYIMIEAYRYAWFDLTITKNRHSRFLSTNLDDMDKLEAELDAVLSALDKEK